MGEEGLTKGGIVESRQISLGEHRRQAVEFENFDDALRMQPV